MQDWVMDILPAQSRHAGANKDVPYRLEWDRAGQSPLQSPDHKSNVVSGAATYSSGRDFPLETRQWSPRGTTCRKHLCLRAALSPENSVSHTMLRSVQKICECR